MGMLTAKEALDRYSHWPRTAREYADMKRRQPRLEAWADSEAQALRDRWQANSDAYFALKDAEKKDA